MFHRGLVIAAAALAILLGVPGTSQACHQGTHHKTGQPCGGGDGGTGTIIMGCTDYDLAAGECRNGAGDPCRFQRAPEESDLSLTLIDPVCTIDAQLVIPPGDATLGYVLKGGGNRFATSAAFCSGGFDVVITNAGHRALLDDVEIEASCDLESAVAFFGDGINPHTGILIAQNPARPAPGLKIGNVEIVDGGGVYHDVLAIRNSPDLGMATGNSVINNSTIPDLAGAAGLYTGTGILVAAEDGLMMVVGVSGNSVGAGAAGLASSAIQVGPNAIGATVSRNVRADGGDAVAINIEDSLDTEVKQNTVLGGDLAGILIDGASDGTAVANNVMIGSGGLGVAICDNGTNSNIKRNNKVSGYADNGEPATTPCP